MYSIPFWCDGENMVKTKAKKEGKILAILVLGVLVLSIGGIVNQDVSGEKEKGSERQEIYIGHNPIHINGNEDFRNQAAKERWQGDGLTNPYIIEDYEIDACGGTYGIWIENTTVRFVVRHCEVYNATNGQQFPRGSGIFLYNVQGGTITDTTAWGNSYAGIYLYSSNNIIIEKSICGGKTYYGTSQYGIFLYTSNYNLITHCDANGNFYHGIYIVSSNYNTITYNNASGNFYDGICLETSNNNTITYNWFCNNAWYGASVDGTENILHHNNFIRNNAFLTIGQGIYGGYQACGSDNNYWYDPTTKEGNFWSNWNEDYLAGFYRIDDKYPLSAPVGNLSVSMTIEEGRMQIVGEKGSTLIVSISVYYGESDFGRVIRIPNVVTTLKFDKGGLRATAIKTDQDGKANVVIIITEDFTSDTQVKVIPVVAGIEYSKEGINLTVKAKATSSPPTPGFEFTALLGVIAIASLLAYARRREH